MVKLSGYLIWEVFEWFLSTLLGVMVTIPNTLKCNPVTKLGDHTHIDRMPFLLCRCGRFNVIGRYWVDDDGCSGEAPRVVRSSPRRSWLSLIMTASGDALCCTVVCLGLEITFITLIHEGWLSRAQKHRGNVCPTWRECDSTRTQPWLSLLPATAHLAHRCQILATTTALSSRGTLIQMWREQL